MKHGLENKRYVVTIVGAFDQKNKVIGGQVVKTRELYNLMCRKYGREKVAHIDTVGWINNAMILVLKYLYYSASTKSIIMLPAQKGVIIFSRLLYLSKMIFSNKIYYNVIGGWLPKLLLENKDLKRVISKFDGVWIETKSMEKALKREGLSNLTIINNFKVLRKISSNNISTSSITFPLKLCIFSRILKEKGIEDAINAVMQINNKYKETKLSLDIYGPIDPLYKESFMLQQQSFPSYIRYNGVVDANDSSTVLSKYSMLLFPTHYKTEGIPGTIIDAYFAGIPVLAARWNSFSDVVDEGITGFGYEILNNNDLIKVLEELIENPSMIQACKKRCLKKSEEYTADYVFSQIVASGFNQ